MYSIGQSPRFADSHKQATDVAFYSGTDDKYGKVGLSQSKSFTKGTRKMILSFGQSDNPCEKYYNNVTPSNIK